MHYLTQICKGAIAVFLTAMVAVLFSTLTGCRGCSAEEEKEEVRWVPARRDTIPKKVVVVENTLQRAPVVVEETVVATKPAKKKQPVSKYKSQEIYKRYKRTTTRPWSEELNPDSIKLTIITSDLEVQIMQQKLN